MNELAQALIDESYAAAPSHVLEGLTDDLVHREFPNVPHTIYAELWHIVFWQQLTLDWIAGIETVYPKNPSEGFPQNSPHRVMGTTPPTLPPRSRTSSGRSARHPSSRTTRPLPVLSRRSHPHYVRARPTHLARRPQRLPPRPHRPSSPDPAGMAASLRRLHLVGALCDPIPTCDNSAKNMDCRPAFKFLRP